MDNRAFGVDVSRYDGLIDFGKVVAHMPRVVFMGFRATISWGYRDPFFTANWQKAKGLVLRTAYHVFYPGEDAARQADNLFAALNGDYGELPVTIDVELDHGYPKSTITRNLHRILDIVQIHTGRKPIIYTRAGWANEHLYPAEFKEYDWWLAHYLRKPPLAKYAAEHPGPPALPNGIDRWLIHQTGDQLPAFCAGTTKQYQDYNRWNGSADDVYKYANVLKPPAELPVTPPGTPEGNVLRFKVIADAMNVRNAPGTQNAIIGKLARGQVVTAQNVGGNDSWIEIAPGRWVAVQYGGKKYLELVR